MIMYDRNHDPITFQGVLNKKNKTVENPFETDESVLENILNELLKTKKQTDTSYLPSGSIIFDEFKDAILGYDLNDQIVYSYDKCIDILINEQEMSLEDAVEWMDYNVIPITTEECKPIFVKYI